MGLKKVTANKFSELCFYSLQSKLIHFNLIEYFDIFRTMLNCRLGESYLRRSISCPYGKYEATANRTFSVA